MAYIFDPDRLHEIAQEAVGLPPEEIHDAVAAPLAQAYPGHIETHVHWIFNNAGGAMGQLTLLHASLSEYLLLFGSPIGTEGHSGRYRCDVHDFMIAGEIWCYREGEMQRSVYKAGDALHLGRSQIKGYRIPDFAWMLEYARGPIVTMLPFGLADTVFSTLDLRTLGRTFWHYGRLATKELGRGKI